MRGHFSGGGLRRLNRHYQSEETDTLLFSAIFGNAESGGDPTTYWSGAGEYTTARRFKIKTGLVENNTGGNIFIWGGHYDTSRDAVEYSHFQSGRTSGGVPVFRMMPYAGNHGINGNTAAEISTADAAGVTVLVGGGGEYSIHTAAGGEIIVGGFPVGTQFGYFTDDRTGAGRVYYSILFTASTDAEPQNGRYGTYKIKVEVYI